MADVQAVLDALSSPIRREILWLVWDDWLTAGAIAANFSVSAPTISAHLAVLREAELVSMVREGTFRRYRARHEVLAAINAALVPDAAKWATTGLTHGHRADPHAFVPAVRLAVEVAVSRPEAFAAFMDGACFSAWLGAEVTIAGRRFTATMPGGRMVRGTLEIVVEPELIAMAWDAATGELPVPGRQAVGYLRFEETDGGTRIEVQQLCDFAEQAAFMERAWTYVLARFEAAHQP
jgi:DNA-binding transcriptional ArsR family regulator/uncharacterized protein YndB with AHSA1/START domain